MTWRLVRWRVIDAAPVMEGVWSLAAAPGFAQRRVVDARLGLTLRHHRVTVFYTRNVKDFEGLGFERLVNPFEG